MIKLIQSVTDQTFKVITRNKPPVATSMIIEDEAQNTSVTINIIPTVDTYYLSITETLTLVEGRFYTLTVLNGLDVVYKDKIFCTNQATADYSINNGEYVQNTTNNDYIITT